MSGDSESSAGLRDEGTDSRLPKVSVVVATRDRPELLERAVSAIMGQDYGGEIECLIVFDRCDPHELLVSPPPHRAVRTLSNERSPGLAGARNSGIIAAQGELVAFCDDDDEWLPSKLRHQVELFGRHRAAAVAATGIRIHTEGGSHLRIAPGRVDHRDYLSSRVGEIHPSTLLLRRADLLGPIGLVDEQVPSSYGEDYELLLRASRLGYTVNVEMPLVNIYWNRPSFFSGRWEAVAAGLTYILGRFPEFATVPRGRARIEGQVAFAHAAAGRRREALRWARRSLADDRRQLRAFAAVAVSLGLVSPGWLMEKVQRRGKGL